MYMILILASILIVSFVLALRSMGDINIPKEIQKLIQEKRHTGRIVFFKDKKTKHYSSSSSSSLRSSG